MRHTIPKYIRATTPPLSERKQSKKGKEKSTKQRFIRFKRLKRIKQSFQLHNIKRVMDTGGATVRDMHT